MNRCTHVILGEAQARYAASGAVLGLAVVLTASACCQEDATYRQYAVHSSLDMVDEAVWNTPNKYGIEALLSRLHGTVSDAFAVRCSYLKAVDRVGDALVSAYVTAGQVPACRLRGLGALGSSLTDICAMVVVC